MERRLEKLANEIFFIVGSSRSGTTLLQAMLSNGADVAIPPETHFYKHIWLRRYEFKDLKKEKNLQKMLLFLFRTRCFKDLQIPKETVEIRIKLNDRSIRTIFLVMLDEYLKKVNKRRIGEKTPPHIHYVFDILEMFPNARIINIIRDPRDVVNSLKKVPWASPYVFGNVRRWLQCVRLHLKYSNCLSEQTYTSVKYEDLVAFPERELKRICKFLNVEYSNEMLNFSKRKVSGYTIREYWKENTFNPIHCDSIGKGIRELGCRRVMLVEWMTYREMKLLGYENIYSRNHICFFLIIGSIIGHLKYLFLAAIKVLIKSGPSVLLRSRPGK